MTSVYPYALLSEDVYKPRSLNLSPELKSLGWKRHKFDGLEEAIFAKGFYGRIYYNLKRNEIVVAYRGTVWSKWQNYLQNADIIIYKEKGRYHQSAKYLIDIANERVSELLLNKTTYRLTLTGHSLGGMMAKILAAENPRLRAIAFDSPGIGDVDGIPSTELREVEVQSEPVCTGIPTGNPFNGVFQSTSKIACHQTSRRFEQVFKKQYSNIQTIIVKNSLFSRPGTQVGYVSKLDINSFCSESSLLDQAIKGIKIGSRGGIAGTMLGAGGTTAYCARQLHILESIITALRDEPVAVMV